MASNSLEELRKRLLGDESVQQMIRVRAYEIYQMRGIQCGGSAQDWFQAESEVLAFLLAHEPNRVSDQRGAGSAGASTPDAQQDKPLPRKAKPRASSKAPGAKKAASKKTPTKRTGSKNKAESKPKPKRSPKNPKSQDGAP